MNVRALLLTAAFSLGLGTAVAQDTPEAEAPPAVGPTTYQLGKGTLIVVVRKDESTLAAGISHNHAVQARGWSGSFTYDPSAPSTCSVDVTVPVQQLTPDEPLARSIAGLEGEVDEGQREDIKKNILSSYQLDAASHPTMTFKSTGCVLENSTLKLSGSLTIKGTTRPVTIPLRNFSADGSALRGSGTLVISGSSFGVEPYSAMFGQLKNQDRWTFIFKLKGQS